MAFEGSGSWPAGDFMRWLEKKRDENLEEDEQPLPEVTASGGVQLPSIGASVG